MYVLAYMNMFGYTHLNAMESIILKETTKFHAKNK